MRAVYLAFSMKAEQRKKMSKKRTHNE